jgi:PAS domain S-box-containing protein
LIALRVTLTFAVVSGLWIFFSDQALGLFVRDAHQMAELSTVKGWIYVLVVSVLVYVQIQTSVRRLDSIHREVVRQKEQLLLFEFTVEKAADMVLWVNQDNRVTYANQAAVRQLGYPAHVLRTLSMDALSDANDLDRAEIWSRLPQERSIHLTRALRAADGRVFSAEMRLDLIDFRGAAFACAWVHDLTEKLRVEDQLRQAQKLESVGTLAAGVAHDFNNILTVIQGCSELLVLSLEEPRQSRPLVQQIQAAVGRASQLVRGLLTFGRKETLNLRRVSFNDIVARSAGFLEGVVGQGIEIQMSLCTEPTTVDADAALCERVVLNLGVNARDAMGGAGRLTLATCVSERSVVLTVTDTGPGIPSGVQARIFEPFFTTKEAGSGTGLGLSIVHGIVSQHHGSVRVDSPPRGATGPGGAEFTIRLPLADAELPG